MSAICHGNSGCVPSIFPPVPNIFSDAEVDDAITAPSSSIHPSLALKTAMLQHAATRFPIFQVPAIPKGSVQNPTLQDNFYQIRIPCLDLDEGFRASAVSRPEPHGASRSSSKTINLRLFVRFTLSFVGSRNRTLGLYPGHQLCAGTSSHLLLLRPIMAFAE